MISKLRSRVSVALGDLRMVRPGILGVQLDMMKMATSYEHSEKPTREIVLGNKTLTVLAEPVSYHEGKKYKTSCPPITELDFASSSWRRAVLTLPAPELSWLLYCYANKIFDFDIQSEICSSIWLDFLRRHRTQGFKKMKQQTLNTMRELVFFTIQQVRLHIISGMSEPFPTNDLMCRLTGICEETWRKHYKKRWAFMVDVCIELDERALLLTKVARDESIKNNRAGYAELPLQAGIVQATRTPTPQIFVGEK